ncbi:MAG: hypothetical protein ABFD49_08965 [Armatimonadota bacterium]|nr:hypothetical protein [bacterium]
MKYARWTLVMLMFILAASVVWAQCPTCVRTAPVQVQTQCPQPCQVCPKPCAEPCQVCPQPCGCPCPAAVPAATGAGPAAGLECLECPNFDPAYASRMYEQNSVIIAVTEYGMQRTTNGNLRNISGEINGYLTSANAKLQRWYGNMACAQVSPDCGRAQAIIADLESQPCDCFDAVYASTLSQLLQQSRAADTLGATRAATPAMRQQAQFLASKDANWVFRLDRWVGDHR